MFFANPIYLWSLLGVLIPIGIHLWSRHEARTVKVGSIELLEASDTVRSRAIRPNEWWLLLLRVLLVALLALILSGPRTSTPAPEVGLVYVFEASLLRDGLPPGVITGPEGSSQVRLLEEGLPEWDPEDTPPDFTQPPGYWQLVPELNALNADSVLVFTRGYLKGTRSKRPGSAGHVRWTGPEDSDPYEQPLLARGGADTAELYTIRSSAGQTAFDRHLITASRGDFSVTEGGDSIRLKGENGGHLLPLHPTEPLQVGLYTGSGMQVSSSYLEAALRAVSTYLDQEVRVEKAPATDGGIATGSDLVVWLSADPPPETDGKMIYFGPDSLARELIEPGLKQGHYRLTEKLNAGNSVSGHLPERLMQVLLPPAQWEPPVRMADRRQWEAGMLGVSRAADPEKGRSGKGMEGPKKDRELESRDVSNYFWLAVLFLLTAERLLALWRRQ